MMQFLSDALEALRLKFGPPAPRPKIKAYLIGEGYLTSSKDGKPIRWYPYRMHYSPGHRHGEIGFSEGDVRNSQGTSMCARDALRIEWRGHIKTVEAEWLIPLLERMAAGEEVPPEEILQGYRQAHGEEPEREEWDAEL